jgi:cell wall assembly regulator SMI1
VTIEELVQAIDGKSPPANETEIAAFEAELGATLPADYRRFLVLCNGGHLGGTLWYIGPTPEGRTADAGIHHIGGFRGESYFSLRANRAVYQGSEVRIPLELLWIMDDPFGNAICLGVDGPSRGKVFFWDHEVPPTLGVWNGRVESAENIQLLADSFTEFVSGLHPTEG